MSTATVSSTDQGFSLLRLWRNKESRSVIIQIITVAVLFAFFAFLISNAATNLERIGKNYNFAFLWEASNYDISQTMIAYTSQSSNFQAMIVGILNTLMVAIFGIITATLLGFFMGVVRLSNNFVANRMVYCVIEFIRNVPVLLHIVLIYGIVVNVLPHPKAAMNLADTFFLSNRGLYFPAPEFGDAFIFVTISFVAGIIGAFLFARHAHKVQDDTGKALPVFWASLGFIIGLPVVVYFISGMPLEWIPATQGKFNLKGGMPLKPEFLALWLALSVYTACFIAEIVRAGIVAIDYGQTEAAHALGISSGRSTQLVIIPQALRVIIPPLTSQYLNLTKNSSLAIAVGYMDIMGTIGGVSLNQTGREMECMTIVLVLYLAMSLMISAFMNWYNSRIKLVER
ncbi:MAG: ABC transporter permease subunit [Rhodospirillales bacterium]|jgi:general L-amino acid transport system permease protein|nr:ABC transporter permease subunit [Rhodospirillales bacterium]MBT4038707.1 ABC transporter permease subunit [Rhodospirillales bacterium]MBT5350396.1 ABC transporter permease subunit [Rhodospirillales bacterium]MBT5519701.1 ABC transporter permease subunit [Rhodospirillales bacterium]MBT6826625.1 ABC transporter permease subunit [Rhodospirillales bacterium]